MVPHANYQKLPVVAYNDYDNNPHFDDLQVLMDCYSLFLNSMMIQLYVIHHIHIDAHACQIHLALMARLQNSSPPTLEY